MYNIVNIEPHLLKIYKIRMVISIMQTCRSNHKNQDIIRNNRQIVAGTGRI